MVSPNGPVLTASVAALRRVRQRQEREDQLGEAVGLLEMRVAGQDEGVDADRPVLLHPRRHLLGRADQRRPGAAAHQADAGPQIGADHELVAPAAMERAIRLWPTESMRAKIDCALAMVSSSTMADQRVRRRPGLLARSRGR